MAVPGRDDQDDDVRRHRNGLRTAVLLSALSGLVLLAGWWIGGRTGLTMALLLSLGMNGIAYFWSDKLALASMHARPIGAHEQPVMYRIVRELATATGQPMPRLYVAPTFTPNAFATGRSPRKAAVCCTTGILRILDARELRAVLGHELAHVYNRDILIASVAAGLASCIMYLAQLAWFLPFGHHDDEGNPVSALLVLILGPMAATLIQFAISRSREFEADADGAQLTGDPIALASALRKLELGTRQLPLEPSPRLQPTSSLMIVNPFRPAGLAKLFSTHPPVSERIARLQALARTMR